ncbi:hypothetical protein JCM14469_12070 [Desulfatiferula olefinivorans]
MIKTFLAHCVLFLLVVGPALPLYAGPTELSDNQLTDMAVDDSVSPEAKTDENGNPLPPASDLIKNPVDDPAEISKTEVLRLENQAADQRVMDQIQNTLQGVGNPE